MYTIAKLSVNEVLLVDYALLKQIAYKVYKCRDWPEAEKHNLAIHIGALQGLAGGAEVIKRMTKAYFGYRPKKLIVWCMRCIAEVLYK